jgi:drug/metabolite transporter superfamily protein YnfA
MIRWLNIARWLAAILLLLGSGWSFNIATYNWFAADQHTEYSRAYGSHGNVFSAVALALLAASVSLMVVNIRSRKKRGMAKA